MWQVRETLESHRTMLADEPRVAAFARAIAATVRPGDVVLDIGTGTGILAMLAARAGARTVYAIEATTVAELARRVVAANGFADRIVVVEASSHDVTLPERADVLVSELIWNGGPGEAIRATFLDAQARLLRPGARIVPARMETWVAPVDSPGSFESVNTWSAQLAGFDFTPVREVATDATFTRWFDESELLAEGRLIGAMDLTQGADLIAGEASFTVARDGVLHGLGSWFSAELAPGVHLTNAPPRRGSWMHAFLPIAEPLEVRAGEDVRARVAVRSDDELWEWTVAVGGRVQSGSTLAAHVQPLRAE